MKKQICIMLCFVLLFIMVGCGNHVAEGRQENALPEANMESKTLIVYFSATGTTKTLAEYAAEILDADIYEIVAEDPYTEADLAYYTNCRADQEQNDPLARPEISGSVENMEDYDIIVLGYPIWLAYHKLIQCTL